MVYTKQPFVAVVIESTSILVAAAAETIPPGWIEEVGLAAYPLERGLALGTVKVFQSQDRCLFVEGNRNESTPSIVNAS